MGRPGELPRRLLHDQMFRGTVLRTSIVWVVGSLVPQFLIGFAMALWLRRRFRFRGALPGAGVLPLGDLGVPDRHPVPLDVQQRVRRRQRPADEGAPDRQPVPWLADPAYAMVAVIIANIWYGVTFFAIMILAALQSIPDELYEAAATRRRRQGPHPVPASPSRHPDHAGADRAAAGDLDLQLPRTDLRHDRRRPGQRDAHRDHVDDPDHPAGRLRQAPRRWA